LLLSTRFCAERPLRGRSVSSRDNFIIQRLLLQTCSCVDRPLRGRCHRVWLSSNAPFNAQCCLSMFLRTSNSPSSTPRDSTFYIFVDLQLRVLSCSFYRIHRHFTSRIHRDDFGEIKAIVFVLFRSTVWVTLLLSINEMLTIAGSHFSYPVQRVLNRISFQSVLAVHSPTNRIIHPSVIGVHSEAVLQHGLRGNVHHFNHLWLFNASKHRLRFRAHERFSKHRTYFLAIVL
jgi:hypothetical protein